MDFCHMGDVSRGMEAQVDGGGPSSLRVDTRGYLCGRVLIGTL